MEIAGLAIGAAGLATLFSGCMDAFDRVHVARTQDSALRILSTKLENQKVRFIIWGQSLGLDSADGYHPQLDQPIRRDSVRRTMTLVYDLFMEGDCLQTRYGLHKEQAETTTAVAMYDPKMDQSVWKDFFRKIRVKAKKQQQQQQPHLQKTPSLQSKSSSGESEGNVMRWMIADRSDFMALVTNLRELIDDLESMCKFADVHRYRRMRVTWEIESMGDTESLHLIRAASEDDDDDAMSIAASQRLDELEYPTDEEPIFLQSPHAVATGVNTEIFQTVEESLPAAAAEVLRYYTPPGFPAAHQPPPRSRSRSRSRSPPAMQESGRRGASKLFKRRSRRAAEPDKQPASQLDMDFDLPTYSPHETAASSSVTSPPAQMGDAGPLRPLNPPAITRPGLLMGPRGREPISLVPEEKPWDAPDGSHESSSQAPGLPITLPTRPGRYQRIAEQVREKRSTQPRRTRAQFSSIQESDEEDEVAVYWVPQPVPDGSLYHYNTVTASKSSSTEKPGQEPALGKKSGTDQNTEYRAEVGQVSTAREDEDNPPEDAKSTERHVSVLPSTSSPRE